MPLFPSTEWMVAFCDELRAHPDAEKVAAGLDGVYRFVVEPEGPLAVTHRYDVAIRPTGAGAQVDLLDGEGHEAPRLTLTADYQRWQQLIRRELDVGVAVVLRRLKVSGDLTSLRGSLSSAQPLVHALAAVDTTWLEDA
ncbi:MAG: SCP2 sterol-binding domain-containing protein [Actinomycetota bacterium]|nr:SCP2 sterol-binding domain-containing protein [Actinomycetota bacterium]